MESQRLKNQLLNTERHITSSFQDDQYQLQAKVEDSTSNFDDPFRTSLFRPERNIFLQNEPLIDSTGNALQQLEIEHLHEMEEIVFKLNSMEQRLHALHKENEDLRSELKSRTSFKTLQASCINKGLEVMLEGSERQIMQHLKIFESRILNITHLVEIAKEKRLENKKERERLTDLEHSAYRNKCFELEATMIKNLETIELLSSELKTKEKLLSEVDLNLRIVREPSNQSSINPNQVCIENYSQGA